jgi:hypothetical protein
MRAILSVAVGFSCTSIIMFAFQALGFSVSAFFHGGGFLLCVAAASVAVYKALGHLRWFRDKVRP